MIVAYFQLVSTHFSRTIKRRDGICHIPESETTVPVCYRGSFLAQRKQFLNQPEESWVKMEASLSRADNIVEGHYAERMWASALSDHDDESARAVDEVLSPHIVFTRKALPLRVCFMLRKALKSRFLDTRTFVEGLV